MNFTRHLPTNNRTNAQGRNTMLTSRWNKTRQLLKGCLFGGLITVLSVTGAQATDIRYFHNDNLGTPQVMTDENQTVVWDVEYDPFGDATVNTETVTNNVRFPGQYYDEETGLHYNYFRTYDPSLGRYITSDPIGLWGGTSTYGYVFQNPISNTDPTGLICGTGVCVGVGIAIGTGIRAGVNAGVHYLWPRIGNAIGIAVASQGSGDFWDDLNGDIPESPRKNRRVFSLSHATMTDS